MTSIKQFYLLKLAEECSEIAQQACKQIQFGHYPTSPSTGKAYDNLQLLRGEVNDLLAVLDVLMQLGELPKISPAELVAAKDKKRARILDYLRHLQELGLVEKDYPVMNKLNKLREVCTKHGWVLPCPVCFGIVLTKIEESKG